MWKTLSSKVIHKNNWYRLVHEKFRFEDGKSGDYYIVATDGSSIVVPVHGKKIVLVRQYRYPIQRWNLELPAGGVKSGSNYLRTAKEELAEETGYRAKNLRCIGKFAPFMGVSNEICRVYLATGLTYIGNNLEKTEKIKILEYSWKDVLNLIDENKIIDGMTLAALSLASKHVKEII
jgi:ADP-ribose pyrophosphatase